MDPLAALSLASNIMQVIQFSAETLAVFERLNEGSSPDPYVNTNSQSLVTATTKLRSTLHAPSVINGVPRDASLLQVCNEIVLIADALQKQVQKSLPARGESKTKLLRKSVAFQLKYKSATEKLSRQLDKLQHRMETEILIDLRQVLAQDNSDLVDRLRTLDKDLIAFRANLIAGQTRLEDLLDRESGDTRKAIADEAQKIRDHNAKSAQETRGFINATQNDRINDAAYQQFLDSFRFRGINARRNTIEFSQPDTFEWIFAVPEEAQESDDVPKWSNFPAWLRGGTGLYWISGKAGAGKSTLMKFLLEDERTRKILTENGSDTMLVSAFIWSLGTSMQKSLIGVLCTLLYDIFAQDRELCWRQMTERQGGFDFKQESSDWSLQELVSLFSTVAENCTRPLCIFIDGLDEIDRSKPTEITRLMEWVESTRSLKNLQICVSSRPEPTFDNRLRQHPHLRVQDLTTKDIEHYVSSILRHLEFDFQVSPQDIQNLIQTIVNRAEGVFLWAHLVVEHIRTDMDYFPSWKTLSERVDELPSGLHSMYKTMWERHNGDSDLYRAETASYLNYLLAGESTWHMRKLLALMLRFNIDIQNMVFKGGDVLSTYFIIKECSRFDVSIVARCGGLVTSSGIPPPRMLPTCEEDRTDLEHRIFGDDNDGSLLEIFFGHRSAADFLLSTSTGQQILSYDRTSAVEHAFCQAKAMSCYGILAGWHKWNWTAMYTLSPSRHEFRLPQFASTAFDLLLKAHQRRPRWIHTVNEPRQRGYSGLNGRISANFVEAGFREQLHERLQQLPVEEMYSLQKQLLSSICASRNLQEVDFVIELLDYIRPEDVSYSTPFLLRKSLVGDLLSYADNMLLSLRQPEEVTTAASRQYRQFVDLLLYKCGGIECLSKWRVLLMLPYYTHRQVRTSDDTSRNTTSKRFHVQYRSGTSERQNSEVSATLVETSILDIFFAIGSPLRNHLADRLSQTEPPCIQKLVMVVHFMTNRNQITGRDDISGFNSEALGDLELTMDLDEVFERLQTLEKPPSSMMRTFSAEDIYALFHADKSEHPPKLSSEETLEFLIKKGYSLQSHLEPKHLPRFWLNDDLLPQDVPKFDEIDWSFEIDCERFERASRTVIERERRAGNPKAVAPCAGGMNYCSASTYLVLPSN
ncbi:hypothetical protein P171DRAFT_433764 [Karstenula rhodostoma CBS 690.94]|uniref:Nephrocystin 3-like N-terminal domain-containing protein n=1 Tax=Karstenula rhodostoma CBS 690.94 TaxID=1392251 RepID=A0A9P4PE13_9PLEO|nr:hypothetical protein P171DRAFT_433764 [Karstenula rhodostoma CBS 690.94]